MVEVITAIYARVSTSDQNSEMQLEDLRSTCAARRWENVKEFVDEGVSGSQRYRPALDRLIGDIKVGRVNRVIVWRFDRMARSALHLLELTDIFALYNVQFISIHESFDTATPMGRAMLTIFAAVSELEKNTINTRIKAGIASAKKKGVRFGRPRVVFDRKIAEEMRANGVSIRGIAQNLKVSQTVVWREMKK